ncbi:MAG: AbrB/MazE/SpoVT family DNA-binding domain-containing protein [Sphingomonadaceae bacterium]|nr:AbrB/MazE/SpoVT family DNA-binding domain-containing protein [Sphingomonadaceae bacterium]
MNAETRLSAKGQIVIPKDVRDSKRWTAGTAFEVIERPDGVLLRPLVRGGTRRIDDVLDELQARLAYRGPRGDEAGWQRSLEEMFNAGK